MFTGLLSSCILPNQRGMMTRPLHKTLEGDDINRMHSYVCQMTRITVARCTFAMPARPPSSVWTLPLPIFPQLIGSWTVP